MKDEERGSVSRTTISQPMPGRRGVERLRATEISGRRAQFATGSLVAKRRSRSLFGCRAARATQRMFRRPAELRRDVWAQGIGTSRVVAMDQSAEIATLQEGVLHSGGNLGNAGDLKAERRRLPSAWSRLGAVAGGV
jgi:Flp pilus assembly protein TadD